jgi:tetratricopeptide (TPR) repeat protein
LGSYDTALKLSPQHAEAYYFRANLFYVHQQMPEAIAGYTTAIGLNPALIHAYKAQPPTNRLTDYTSWPVEMSWIAKAAGKILWCDQSLNESAKNIDLYKNRGAAYYELWNYDRAVEDFSAYLSTTPDDVQVVHWRGLAYDQVGQYELAIADYVKAIELDPNSSSAYYIDRGVSYGKMGDLQHSLADFDKAIQLNPNNPKGYYNRAMVCYRLEEFDRAIEDLSQVLSLSPDDVGTYRFRGRVYEQIGSNQKAIEDYEAFLRLSRVPQDKANVEQRIENLKRRG